MSFKAKTVFALSSTFTTAMVLGVYYLQNEERYAMREGPRRDDKKLAHKLNLTPEEIKANMERRELNRIELEQQAALYTQLKKEQNTQKVDYLLDSPNSS